MLDYSMNKYEGKKFILYYEEDGDYFKVYCANGDDYPVLNDKENEEKLLKQMEVQVEAADSFYDKQEKERKSARNWLIYDIFFLVLDTFLMCVNPTVIMGFCIGCFVLSTTSNSIKYSFCKKKIDDVKKNRLFLKHKKEINEYVDSVNNTAIYSNTMVPARLENHNPSVTINDVHHMSYDERNKIVNNVERDEKFGIDRGKFRSKMLVKSKDRV